MDSRRVFLILIIFAGLANIPSGFAQTPPQLSLTLVGQNGGHYVAPAGKSIELKMQIFSTARSDIYLLRGDAYLDPNLSGTWELVHSEALGSFQLAYLQSALWTFDLTIPAQIYAANATNGVPQVNLLVKITYQAPDGSQSVEQSTFQLSVPGATLQEQNNTIWFAVAGILIVAGFAAVFTLMRRRRR